MGGEWPLCEGVGSVECLIIEDRVNSVEMSLCTGYVSAESHSGRGTTFGTSIFLIGMYRFGIADRALRTVSSLVSAIIPDNTPYLSVRGLERGEYSSDIRSDKNEDVKVSPSTLCQCECLFNQVIASHQQG